MQVNVIDFNNKVVGTKDLVDTIFALEPRSDILHRVVVYQMANARSGNHKVKTVSEVSGSGKKAFKQKKTGNARQGEKYNVHMRGGGVVHGPVVRSHAIDLPKKIRALGLKMALSSKLKESDLLVIKSEKLSEMKTSSFAKTLRRMGIDSALFVCGTSIDSNFRKSISNLINIDVLPTIGLNVLDILKHKKLVLTEEAVSAVVARLS